MLNILTDEENQMMIMLIQGQSFSIISEWLCIDYNKYISLKKSILKKLCIKRITELLPTVLKMGIDIEDI